MTPRHFARIPLMALRNLDANEKLLFIMLCNAIDEEKTRTLPYNVLREMLYGKLRDDIENRLNLKTVKMQRYRAKKIALSMIEKVPGWEAENTSLGLEIFRPRESRPPDAKNNVADNAASARKRTKRRKRDAAPQ